MDMMAQRHRMIAAQSRQVLWNQYAPDISTWVPFSTDFVSMSVSGNVATITYLNATNGDKGTIRTQDNYGHTIKDGDLWYGSFMVNPSWDGGECTMEFARRRGTVLIHPAANTWTRNSMVHSANGDRDGQRVYLPEWSSTGRPTSGKTTQVKCPVLVNLTLMYGAGREPNAEEFEHQCGLNGIDLTNPIPYNAGTTRTWRL